MGFRTAVVVAIAAALSLALLASGPIGSGPLVGEGWAKPYEDAPEEWPDGAVEEPGPPRFHLLADEVRVPGRKLNLEVACLSFAPGECSGRLRLLPRRPGAGKPGRPIFGRSHFSIPSRTYSPVGLKLTKRGRAKLRRRCLLRVQASVRGLDAAGVPTRGRAPLLLERQRCWQ